MAEIATVNVSVSCLDFYFVRHFLTRLKKKRDRAQKHCQRLAVELAKAVDCLERANWEKSPNGETWRPKLGNSVLAMRMMKAWEERDSERESRIVCERKWARAQKHCERLANELASIKRAIGVVLEGDMSLIEGQPPVTVEEVLLVRRMREKLQARLIVEQIDEQRA